MKFYLAPLEGLTGHVFRRNQARYFSQADKYFTPFIAPNQYGKYSHREKKDIAPENNPGLYTVPQLLTNNAEDFIRTCDSLHKIGYKEVNLNLGCPSRTVVPKKRGSGFLVDLPMLEDFLNQIFENPQVDISVKTRLGLEDQEEFGPIMELYNRYPMKELIIHPRIQQEFYKGTPHLDTFGEALKSASMPVVYNGDIFTVEDLERFKKEFPSIDRVMLGRGLIANPQLIGEMKGEEPLDKERLWEFLETLTEEYRIEMSGDRDVLFKMKEVWFYLGRMWDNYDRYEKKIKKTKSLGEYDMIIKELFREGNIQHKPLKFQ